MQPKFLSKKQREELALQRLKEQAEAKKARQAFQVTLISANCIAQNVNLEALTKLLAVSIRRTLNFDEVSVISHHSRVAEVSGGHDPYKGTLERQRLERKRESDRKLEEDRQKLKEVCRQKQSHLFCDSDIV